MNYEAKYLEIIKQILFKHVDQRSCRVFLFGSRASGTHERHSDVDIGIEGQSEIDSINLTRIKSEIEDSIVPYRVDVVDFYAADQAFKDIALKDIIPWN